MAFGDLKGGTGLTNAANSITNPFSVTGSVAVNIGDLIFAVLGEQTSLTVTACGDNLHGGSTYTATQAGTDAGTSTGRAFYKRVTVAGTLTSVDFVTTGSTDNVAAAVAIFEGPFDSSPLDGNPTNITSDITSPFTCPSTGTLAQASEIVLGWAVATGSTVWAATSPNTLGPQIATQAILHTLIGYQTVNATTAVLPAFTAGSNPTDAVLGTASFKQDLNLIQPNPKIYYPPRSAWRVPRTGLRNFSYVFPEVNIPKDLAPSLFTDENTFYSATVTVPTLVERAPLFQKRSFYKLRHRHLSVGTPLSTIPVGGNQDLTPSLYTDPDTFYVETVSLQELPAGAVPDERRLNRRPRDWRRRAFSVSAPYPQGQDLTPSLYVDTDSFYTHVVSLQELPAGAVPDVRTLNRRRIQPRVRVPSVSAPYPPTADLVPSLYVDADSFYAPAVTSTINLSPALYTDADTFYIPVVSLQEIPSQVADVRRRGPAARQKQRVLSVSAPYPPTSDLTPSLYVDVDTFYTHVVTLQEIPASSSPDVRVLNRHRREIERRVSSVSAPYPPGVDLTPSLYSDADTFYDPIVSQGSITLQPNLYVDVDAFYSATVGRGAVDLAPNLYVDADSFYSPTVVSVYNLSPSLYVDADSFYSATVTRGSVNLLTSLFVDGDTFYSGTVAGGAVNLTPSLFVDGDTFYSSVIGSTYDLAPNLYIDADTFYSPSVIFATQDLKPGLYVDVDTFYSPTSTGTINLSPALFVNTNVFYSPKIPQEGDAGIGWWWEWYKARHEALRRIIIVGEGRLMGPIGEINAEGEVLDPKSEIEAPKGRLSANGVCGNSGQGNIGGSLGTTVEGTLVAGVNANAEIQKKNLGHIDARLSGEVLGTVTIASLDGKVFSNGIVQRKAFGSIISGVKTSIESNIEVVESIERRIITGKIVSRITASIFAKFEVGYLGQGQIKSNIGGVLTEGVCGKTGIVSIGKVPETFVNGNIETGIKGRTNIGKIPATVVSGFAIANVEPIDGRGSISSDKGLLVSYGEHYYVPSVPEMVVGSGGVKFVVPRNLLVVGEHVSPRDQVVEGRGLIETRIGFITSIGNSWSPPTPVVVFRGKIQNPVMAAIGASGEHDPDNEDDLTAVLLLAA